VSGVFYRERLSPPPTWWVLGVLFALSVFAALAVATGIGWALGVAALCFAVTAALFGSLALTISLTEGELRVGRSRIELCYLAECAALDAVQTRRRAGPEADARAHLVLRPYVPTAVEITLDDPADPVPYWLVSSRRPRQLAEAVEAARSRGPRTSGAR